MRNIDSFVDKLAAKCKENHFSLVAAESCTGGGLAYQFSKNPNCSAMLERSYVTYSNSAKEDCLGVLTSSLLTYGAVSKEVAIEMAEGALKNSKAHISIATTGIDGAANETTSNDEGLAWISCAGINMKTVTQLKKYTGKREEFCEKVILDAIKLGIKFLK